MGSRQHQYASSRFSLPSALETRVGAARSMTALSYLKLDGLSVRYVGPGEDDSEAATVRTNFPVPPDCPVFYFEVQVVSRGLRGFIGAGFQTEDVLLSRLPGWDPHSYGYHGDDGFAFGGSGQGTAYGPTFTVGDTIGALLSRVDSSIRFFKNGLDLGVAFKEVPEERLYPCVGLRTRGEEVVLNLGRPGDPPFVTDLDTVVAGIMQRQVLEGLDNMPLPVAASGGVPLLPRLVHDHLLHTRCWKTAAALRRDLAQAQAATTGGTTSSQMQCDLPSGRDPGNSSGAVTSNPQDGAAGDAPMADAAPSPTAHGAGAAGAGEPEPSPSGTQGLGGGEDDTAQTPQHIGVRQAVFEMVSSGRILAARERVDACFGAQLLAGSPALDFRLKVAQFCELLRPEGGGGLEAAVAYGRSVLAPHIPKSAEDEELLCDALSLLAYEQPASSPCGHLLGQGVRSALAEDVDRALLAACGLPPTSALERLAAQAMTALETLKASHHPQALLVRVRELGYH